MYGIVVTVSEKNEVQAFKLSVNPGEPLFQQIKADARSRIQESAISADALLPEGPYNLWRQGETSRRVKDLVGAFAQFPHLPKMLRRKEILETLVQGAREGFFVLRRIHADRTAQTFWRQEVGEDALKDPSLEVVLPEAAELTELAPGLLMPQALPGLWSGESITVAEALAYWQGGKVIQVQKQGYEEPVTIPKAERTVVEKALESAIQAGQIWLIAGQVSLCSEPVPAGVLTEKATLRRPPPPIPPAEILPDRLPRAWKEEMTTGLSVLMALSQKAGQTLPWPIVRSAVEAALRTRLIERAVDSGPWPCDVAGAAGLRFRLPDKVPVDIPESPRLPERPGVRVAAADLDIGQFQDLADQLSEIKKAAVGFELKLHVRIEVNGTRPVPPEVVERINSLLSQVANEIRLQ